MPQARFSDQNLGTFTINATDTHDFDLSLVDTFWPQLLVIATWENTGSTTGLSCTIYPGFLTSRNSTGEIEYADNGNEVEEFGDITPTPSSSNQEIKVAFAMNPELYPKRDRLHFSNLDIANPVTIHLYGDW